MNFTQGDGATSRSSQSNFDPVKLNQIFDKILSMTNLEIEERNLKSLAQKIQLKLVDVNYLVQNHGAQVSRLFQWLHHRADTILKRMPSGAPGTTCSMQAIANFANIFLAVSKSMEGRALI